MSKDDLRFEKEQLMASGIEIDRSTWNQNSKSVTPMSITATHNKKGWNKIKHHENHSLYPKDVKNMINLEIKQEKENTKPHQYHVCWFFFCAFFYCLKKKTRTLLVFLGLRNFAIVCTCNTHTYVHRNNFCLNR